jgi:hypothetical protein
MISLSSALPQFYTKDVAKFFGNNILGKYHANLSAHVPHLISVGGSNATRAGWTSFLGRVATAPRDFLAECDRRGLAGIDFDLEGTTAAHLAGIRAFVAGLKAARPAFIVQYTILLGSPQTWAPLLDTDYDYLALMLYNGGMYSAKGTGAGCDWDGWLELILSRGRAGCAKPLIEPAAQYAKAARLHLVDPAKVLPIVITDTWKKSARFDPAMRGRLDALVAKYGAAGSMLWVLPGWAVAARKNIANAAAAFGLDEEALRHSCLA